MRRFIIGALAAAALAAGAATAQATTWGPWTTSIPASGGFQQCGPNLPAGANQAWMRSYQGSRHPWTVATYDGSNSVIAVAGGITDDSWWMPGVPTYAIHVIRGDNRAAGGSGGYQCFFAGP